MGKTIAWYENQLNNNQNLSNTQIEEYEAAIERLADIEAKAHERVVARQKAEKQRLQEIKAKLQAGDVNVIDAFGIPEFGSDYELIKEQTGHVIYSKVAREDQESRHLHNTEGEAVAHYRKLIWDRLYTKYVRTGEIDSLRDME